MNLTRRSLIASTLGRNLLGAGSKLRFSICNETFEGCTVQVAGAAARRAGFAGLEIAPFTLSEDPALLSKEERRRLREEIEAAGLEYAGMHAFLQAPKGLHLTCPDAGVRARSWTCFRKMIDLAADFKAGSIMVLGSGKQRGAIDGATPAQATARLRDGLAAIAPHAVSRGVTVLLEPLAPHLCNVVNSLDEAVAIIQEIDSPGLATIFDTHNAVQETVPHDQLIRRHFRWIRHVHVNEMDGRYPGSGNYDFDLILHTLSALSYGGWISVEVFDFKPDGEFIARESYRRLLKGTGQLGARAVIGQFGDRRQRC